MYKLEPMALTAENDRPYKVRFSTDNGEIVFAFKIDEEPFCTLGWDPAFSGMVNGDPAAHILNKAIFEFHEARKWSKLRAIELIAESANSYIVRFLNAGTDVAYTFIFENFESVKFDGQFNILDLGDSIRIEDHFLEVIDGDPAADRLKRAICYFHQAIHFEYEPQTDELSHIG
jgi:hypothetical protein